MWYLIVCLIFAFICSGTAIKKGRDKRPWFLFGLLTGPIALIVLLLMPNDDVGLGYKKCPYCAEYVKPEARVCKHCSRDLSPSSDESDTLPCSRCGHENPVAAMQCEDCKYRFVA